MKILGLDNSTAATGWAVLVHKGRIECGSFGLRGATDAEKFGSYDASLQGLIEKHAETPEPIVGVAMEEPLPGGRGRYVPRTNDLVGGMKFVNPTNHSTQVLLYGLRGIALARLGRLGIPVLGVAPREWRSAIFPKGTQPPPYNERGQPLTDQQRSDWWKNETVRWMRMLGVHVPMRITPTGRVSTRVSDHDAADAAGIAMWGVSKFTKGQYREQLK